MTLHELLRHQPVIWHGVTLNAPDWGHESHTLAATASLLGNQALLHVIVNAYWEALAFEIPPPGDAGPAWRRLIDTSLESPDDVHAWADASPVPHQTYMVEPRSVVLLSRRRAVATPVCRMRHRGSCASNSRGR